MQTYDMEQICRRRLRFFFWLPPRRVCMEARNVAANVPPAQAEVKVTHADLLTDSTLVSLDSGSLRVEIDHI